MKSNTTEKEMDDKGLSQKAYLCTAAVLALIINITKLGAGDILQFWFMKLKKAIISSSPYGFSLSRRRHSESPFSILPYSLCLPLWHQLPACPPSLRP